MDEKKGLKELLGDKRAKCVAAGGAVALIALIAVVVAMSGAPTPVETAPDNKSDAPVSQVADKQEAAALFPVSVAAEGWTDESTPVVVRLVEAEPAEGTEPRAHYHAVTASEVASGDCLVSVPAGTYEVSYISPINPDGSIYRVPEAQSVELKPVEEAPEAQDGDTESAEEVAETVTLEPVPADQVTKEDVEAILKDLGEACAKGDETLSGDAGQQVLDKAAENASKAPNVGTDGAGEAQQKAEETKAETEAKTPADTGSAQGGGQGGGQSGSSQGGSSQGGAPAHQHTWVTKQVQTGTRQVQTGTRQVQTGTRQVQVGSEPIYENKQVQTGTRASYVTTDGKVFYDRSVGAYCLDHPGVSYSLVEEPIYETQRVQTGSKPIYETQPVYENQPVYSTEPVYGSITVCSSCGAKQ